MKELGMYIHIPFCKKKCYYCDFISYSNKSEWIEEYITCIKEEIKQVAKCNQIALENKEDEAIIIKTIYIGGGTPSYIDGQYIKEIIETARNYLTIDPNAEITIEINPGTVDINKLELYKKAGINRLSIGLQSSNQKTLEILGRIHSYKEFEDAYKTAKKIGFDNINVDLMIGVPNQSIQEVEEGIEKIIKLNPNHISVYSLIIEENTKIQKQIENKELKLPDEKIEREMYWLVKQKLEEAGFIHYEISNFAKKGYESKHNLDCWSQKEYIGFGAAAHSYTNGIRYSNIEDLQTYIQNIKQDKPENNFIFHEKQTHSSKIQEYMLLNLRKLEGVNINKFIEQFNGNPIYIFKEELEKLEKQGLIQIEENIKLTEKGIDLANLVWEEFV